MKVQTVLLESMFNYLDQKIFRTLKRFLAISHLLFSRNSAYILFFILLNVPAFAQTSVTIPKVNGDIVLDGSIDEAVWMDAAQFQLIMHSPQNNVVPTEPTTVYIMYDDRFLYVAGIMTDSEAHKIQSPTKKRDDIGLNNDWFGFFSGYVQR